MPEPHAAGKLPEAMLGAWQGAIETDRGLLPLELHIARDGTISASLQEGEPQPVQLYGVDGDIQLLAIPGVRIPTKDAMCYPHGTLLRIQAREERLTGSATAFGLPGTVPMGSALSYWIDLDKSEETLTRE